MNRIVVPAATALLVVVAFIALSGYNRSDEPLVRLTLTERELRYWNWASVPGDRDPGLELRIDYQRRAEPLDARNWLTDDRLRAIGFNLGVMPAAPEAADTYGRALPRVAWVAFEYNGNAWREIDRQRQLREPAPRHPGTPLLEPSRLVPVDAAPRAETLVARYPENHLILRASIELGYVPPEPRGALVYGWMRALVPAAVHVPREFRDVLMNLPAATADPRYEVDVVVGRLGVPYLTGLRPMSAPGK
jgi:hypothetical protein